MAIDSAHMARLFTGGETFSLCHRVRQARSLEQARLFRFFADWSAMERIALRAAMLIPFLMLQKPKFNSKAKDHKACLERRLQDWETGRFDDLLKEGRALQNHLTACDRYRTQRETNLAHIQY